MANYAHKVTNPHLPVMEAELDLPAMPEVDLLPEWYPVLLHRRRWLTVQAWVTGVMVVLLLAVLVWWRGHVEATHLELASLEVQRRDSAVTLSEVEVEEQRLSSLLGRATLAAKMGLPVEVSRILSDLDAGTPEDVALIAIDVRTEQRLVEVRATAGSPRPAPLLVREMHFRVSGLAKESASAFALSKALQGQPLLRGVEVLNTQPAEPYGRPAWQFDLRFHVDLSAGGGGLSETKGAL